MTSVSPQAIAFIGAGNMTTAIVQGMVKAGYPADLIMTTNRSAEKLAAFAALGVQTSTDNNAALAFAEHIVLAVKPQMLAEVCGALGDSKRDKAYISIAAGVSVERIQAMLGASVSVVRTMPNTPSAVGLGMTGMYAPAEALPESKALAQYCLAQVGKTLWVTREDDINTVIAAAGSAPAYIFLFAEYMQAKTQALGLDEAAAKLLVSQAIAGAGAMLCEAGDTDFATLRANVTSKGGTTAKAIDSFVADNLADTIDKAMQAAVDRAVEMQFQI